MNINYYFSRFLAKKPDSPTYQSLAALQNKHMLHVPFENLDVLSQTPIIIDLERIFQKVIVNLRGGFCYELNGLFGWLLKESGYEVSYISATVKKPDGTWTIEGSHATNLVTIENQPYIVDVGFGDSVRKPMPLNGEVVRDVSGSYRMTNVAEHMYDLQRWEDDVWKTLYRVSTLPKKLTDFTPMCEFNQTSADSPFVHKRLVTIATPTGRITLSGETLTVTDGEKKTKRNVSEEETPGILQNHFYIIKGFY
ncbi:arylamine N-acetyltransferase [Priestia megaterium]